MFFSFLDFMHFPQVPFPPKKQIIKYHDRKEVHRTAKAEVCSFPAISNLS